MKRTFDSVTKFHLNFFLPTLSVRRQKYESQNGCFKKTKHAKFSEKRTFTHTLVRVRIRGSEMFVFSENLACFVFLERPFWDSLFCLITDDLLAVLLSLDAWHVIFSYSGKDLWGKLKPSSDVNLSQKVWSSDVFIRCSTKISCLILSELPGPPGNLVVKSKLSPRSGSVVLRQLNPIDKKES